MFKCHFNCYWLFTFKNPLDILLNMPLNITLIIPLNMPLNFPLNIVLYCIVLYFISLYIIDLHCTALLCIILYSILLNCILLYCIVLLWIVLISIILLWGMKSSKTLTTYMSVVFYDCRNMNRDINYYHTPFESFMSELFKNVFKVEKTLLVSMLLSKNIPDIFIIF